MAVPSCWGPTVTACPSGPSLSDECQSGGFHLPPPVATVPALPPAAPSLVPGLQSFPPAACPHGGGLASLSSTVSLGTPLSLLSELSVVDSAAYATPNAFCSGRLVEARTCSAGVLTNDKRGDHLRHMVSVNQPPAHCLISAEADQLALERFRCSCCLAKATPSRFTH